MNQGSVVASLVVLASLLSFCFLCSDIISFTTPLQKVTTRVQNLQSSCQCLSTVYFTSTAWTNFGPPQFQCSASKQPFNCAPCFCVLYFGLNETINYENGSSYFAAGTLDFLRQSFITAML